MFPSVVLTRLGVDAAAEGVEKRGYLEVGEQRMAKVGAAVDQVAVASAFLRPNDIAVGDEVGDDLLRCAFADAERPSLTSRQGGAGGSHSAGLDAAIDLDNSADGLQPVALFPAGRRTTRVTPPRLVDRTWSVNDRLGSV